jgi:glycosyltransferase involved in cell wall biosynthesis
VAAVTPHKGHLDLAAALALVADLPWTCVLAGSLAVDPTHVSLLRDRLANLGLLDRVQFAGPLTGEALEQVYAAADLLVLPSHSETYGMVVTEALARGIPVLATEVGGVPEALGAGPLPGLLVPAHQPAQLADALRSWLGEGDLRARLRDRAAERRPTLTTWPETSAIVARALDDASPT